MNLQTPYYKLYLRQELARRCQSNQNYSMRSFAKALSIDPAVLSRTLSDKRALSFKVAKRIIQNLSLSSKESSIFLESVAEDHKQRGLSRTNFEEPDNIPAPEYNKIGTELFRIINDWYHYAIHQLTLVEDFDSDPRWIAKRLGLTVLETKLAIQRLLSANLLSEKNGTLVPTALCFESIEKDATSPALLRHQKQILTKAIQSLDDEQHAKRSVTGMTMAIDANKLPIARKLIIDFAKSLCDVLGSGKLTNVYQLSVSLFPLDDSEK